MINLREHMHSPCDVGKLTGHKEKRCEQGTLLSLLYALYVEYSAFIFEDCDQLTRGLNLIYQQFTIFGLKMHGGGKRKLPKPNASSLLPHNFQTET